MGFKPFSSVFMSLVWLGAQVDEDGRVATSFGKVTKGDGEKGQRECATEEKGWMCEAEKLTK